MSTTPINPVPPVYRGNNKKTNVASNVGVTAGAAVLGAAGAAMAANLNDDSIEEPLTIQEEVTDAQGEEHASTDHQSSSSASHHPSGNSDSHPAPAPDPVDPEIDPELIDPDPIDPDPIDPDPVDPGSFIDPEIEDDINPDEIAEAIIAGEQVDPNDIDMDDVINFDEIGTVYTVDGESYMAASFHDGAGNQLVMVDVDGDNVFDIITDMDGNVLADETGMPLTAGDLTVDDAELNIDPAPTYLAHNDDQSVEDFGADSIMDDLIS